MKKEKREKNNIILNKGDYYEEIFDSGIDSGYVCWLFE